MPKITVMPDGCKAAKAAGMNRNPVKRDKATGWSTGAARRNADFLMSIDALALGGGEALSISLTVGRDLAITPRLFLQMRTAFFHRLRRMGLTRLHWLAEFQRDGTPHLHMMAYFPPAEDAHRLCERVTNHWLSVAAATGAQRTGQHVVPVTHLKGWKIYLAKHGARGVNHYQRKMPPGWQEPGRMWGYLGDWPTRKVELEVDAVTFFRFRRFVRSWRVSQARKAVQLDPSSRSARRMLLAARRSLVEGEEGSSARTTFRGLTQWLPEALAVDFLSAVADDPDRLVRRWEARLGTYANTDSQSGDARGGTPCAKPVLALAE